MIVKEKLGNIQDIDIAGRPVDKVMLEWYETSKRILRKRSQGGEEITFRFLHGNPFLASGDIIFVNGESIIIIDVLSCEAIIINVSDMYEMACVCYEIGNKHLPLFFQNNELLVPFERPLYRLLCSAGYNVTEGLRKLVSPLKTSVLPHTHGNTSKSLFSMILNRTTSIDE